MGRPERNALGSGRIRRIEWSQEMSLVSKSHRRGQGGHGRRGGPERWEAARTKPIGNRSGAWVPLEHVYAEKEVNSWTNP